MKTLVMPPGANQDDYEFFKGRLTMFLFLLMRDNLPVGDVVGLVQHACELDPDEEAGYNKPSFAKFANELAQKLEERPL